ncbi:GGDEF domain-containing protein [Demequina gelatinilytica]|uniref:GGDEF domain-containing protein n=1 Tax=Demequina gelatinilytica TaxID=1638980 RepID=UPI001470059E|nr:diguanylate cyclase [Demequina gelatinilytica]
MSRVLRRGRVAPARGVVVGAVLAVTVVLMLMATSVLNAIVADRTVVAATEDMYEYVGDLMAERVAGVADSVADVVVGTANDIAREGSMPETGVLLNIMADQLDDEPAVGSMFVADPSGYVFLLARLGDGYASLRVDPLEEGGTYVVRTEYNADRVPLGTEGARDDYDVTTRSWYQTGLGATDVEWSDPYVSVRTGEIAVSPVKSARAGDEVIAVVGADLDVDLVGDVLEDIPTGGDARAFILASDGSIIAAPTGARDDVRRAVDARMTIPSAEDIGLADGDLVTQQPSQGETPPPGVDGVLPPDHEDAGTTDHVVVERAMDPDTGIDWVLHLDAAPADLAPSVASMQRVTAWATTVSIALVVIAGIVALRLWRPITTMRQRSEIDAVTGLSNRYDFQRRGRMVLRSVRRAQEDALMIALDLDDFKHVNDEFGHDAGDHVLRVIGDSLRGAVRSQDVAARVGGDEFMVLIALADDAAPVEVARRLRDEVEAAIRRTSIVGARVGVTAGFAIGSEVGFDLRHLHTAADRALVAGKRVRKGRTYTQDGPVAADAASGDTEVAAPAGSVPRD